MMKWKKNIKDMQLFLFNIKILFYFFHVYGILTFVFFMSIITSSTLFLSKDEFSSKLILFFYLLVLFNLFF